MSNELSLHGWLTNNSTRGNDLQMGCTTYFVCCLHHTAELPADRQAIPVLPTPSLLNHRFQYTGSQSEESCFKQEADSGWTEGLYKGAQYELKRINTVYWDSYSPALPMRFIASLTFLITYVQKWSDVDHVNASTDLYCLDRKTTPMLSWH